MSGIYTPTLAERACTIVALLELMARCGSERDSVLRLPGWPPVVLRTEAARAWAADRAEIVH